MKVAAQLYTVREQLTADFPGTLRRVRSAGYEYVELAGHGTYSAADLARVLVDCGLTPCSDHCPIERLESDLDQAIQDALTLGVKYVVCPYLPEERRRDEAGWRACATLLNTAGKTCRERGIQLCYHHHSFEFVRLGNRSALELLFDETDPAYVQAELDTYWIKDGGADPAEFIAKLAGRCPLLHLKDMAPGQEPPFAAIGTGILDWPAILSAAQTAGVQWAIVEQDACPTDPVECLRASLKNLAALGIRTLN